MKRTPVVISMLLFAGLFAQNSNHSSAPGVPVLTNVRGAEYPRIQPDNRVMFRIKAPEAQKVQIDIVQKYDMVKDTAGTWEVITDPLPAGLHYYSILIDGVVMCDPSNRAFYDMGMDSFDSDFFE